MLITLMICGLSTQGKASWMTNEGRFERRIQPVDATVWLNISAGV
jgi:hypothetical protein